MFSGHWQVSEGPPRGSLDLKLGIYATEIYEIIKTYYSPNL